MEPDMEPVWAGRPSILAFHSVKDLHQEVTCRLRSSFSNLCEAP